LIYVQQRSTRPSYVAIYCVLIVFIDFLIISQYIDRGKEFAAKIQEVFDVNLYKIAWNEVLVGTKPSNEEVNELRKRYLRKNSNDILPLKDWYNPKVSTVGPLEGALLCQRTNLFWDKKLREEVNKRVLVWTGLLSVIYVTASVFQEATVEAFLIMAVIPITPLALYAFRLVKGNGKSIKHLESLKIILDKAWSDASLNLLSEELLRKVQNEIFAHRKNNFPISDALYLRLKKKFEDDSKYNVEKMIDDLT